MCDLHVFIARTAISEQIIPNWRNLYKTPREPANPGHTPPGDLETATN